MSTEAETKPEWPRVIKLKHPIKFGSETIAELTLRRGKAGDMKGIELRDDAIPANDLMRIASRLSGQQIEVIAELDVEDAGEVMSVALDFFTKYLERGKS